MATVLISGGTGMIGTALTKSLLAKGYEVIILTRNAPKDNQGQNVQYAQWDVEKQTIDENAVKKADYIIHLAGAGVADKRWTEERKKEIVGSRVNSGKLLVKALNEIPNNVKAFIAASAIGWYGPDKTLINTKPFTETAPPHSDFLGITCKQWEASIEPIAAMGTRLVILRTGIVLGNGGGAYPEFKKTLKLRVASILGGGKQVVSWIHIDDLVAMYLYALENEHCKGVYNAVAPHPVTNAALVQTIGAVNYSPYVCVHVPQFVLRIMLGEMSVEVLKSATVSAEKFLQAGFVFTHPEIEQAVENLEKE